MNKEIEKKRQQMVDRIRRYDSLNHLRTPAWHISDHTLSAFLKVPREVFVPESQKGMAYDDTPLPIGAKQTISQPYIVALMTELLHVEAGQKVLEIGTGSGYQAAILDALGVEVYTIEIQPSLYQRLTKLFGEEYQATDVHLLQGDGFWGWPEFAPFDAILITAAIREVPPNLLDQLKVHGRLVVPIERFPGHQMLSQITKTENGIDTAEVLQVRFVPFTRDEESK